MYRVTAIFRSPNQPTIGLLDKAGLNFHKSNAKAIGEFIAALSSEFQEKLDDFDSDTVEKFKNLSK
ncbi:hypothetical protein [Pasteurella multocida]|uniref:hypothetical protein n=1 Tax=Pasteurella multocida TaxID=747 RepID=UPI003CF0C6F9